jgi:hemerythrin-like domain-containing protein
MPDAIVMLRVEHENLSRLLNLLDEQCARLEQGAMPDYDLLEVTLEYFAAYPDQCHHPKEDLVFRILQDRDAEAASALTNLADDHEQLAVMTGKFGALVEQTREATDPDINSLRDTITNFVQHYRRHMAMEEQHFFPAAQRLLSRDDWLEIDFQLFDREDPLFDYVAEERFKNLRAQLSRMAKRRVTNMPPASIPDWLGSDTTVASFNDAMKRAGKDVRLKEIASGYSLERHGKPIMSFPESSQSFAAWGAYYFLAGEQCGRESLLD